jgi:starch phosphorylase
VRVFGYTNHTLMPEALERWSVELFGSLLPRHLEIIYEVNRRFLDVAKAKWPGDAERLRRVSLLEEGPDKMVRMAHLAVVGSHSVNGVSRLHAKLLRERLMPELDALFPGRFNAKTNGITPRRWLVGCNPELSALITRKLGSGWETDLSRLRELAPLADDAVFRSEWRDVKRRNKERLIRVIERMTGVAGKPAAMMDVQVKRIHEYKRQLLNLLRVVDHWRRLREGSGSGLPARTCVFGGKAAPGYAMAKLIIRLINGVADAVNRDPLVEDRLKVVFLEDYRVSLAEVIIPGADLSEQISTAGMEASGTGNMKFALNGAVTIGTLDGANIEIREEVGDDNIFIFGATAEEAGRLQGDAYDPRRLIGSTPRLKAVLDLIADGAFSPKQPDLFDPIVESLATRDPFLVCHDFAAYLECQERADRAWRDVEGWTRKSILNAAHMGRFSSDRTIAEYAREIWGVKPCPIHME